MTAEERSRIRAEMDRIAAHFRARRLAGAEPEELDRLFREHSEMFGFMMRDLGGHDIADVMDGLARSLKNTRRH